MEKNLTKVIEDLDYLSKIRLENWVVRYNGNVLVLSSGKSMWKQIGHVKTALINHFETMYPSYYNDNKIEKLGFKNAKELSDFLQQQGIIKIERV